MLIYYITFFIVIFDLVNEMILFHFSVKSAQVVIYFKDFRVSTMGRSVLYTYPDFLAICGGLLGLFLGFSALSVIQFIYCSTIRLFSMLYHLKQTNTSPLERNYIIRQFPSRLFNKNVQLIHDND